MTRAPERPSAGELLPCPFCGGKARIERFGTTQCSTIYVCDECSCRLETDEEFHHGRAWNRRAPRHNEAGTQQLPLSGRLSPETDHNRPDKGGCGRANPLPAVPDAAGSSNLITQGDQP